MEHPSSLMKHGKSLALILLVVVASITLASFTGPVLGILTLSVLPRRVSEVPGASFSVSINVSEATDLYGVDFHLGYDTTVLTANYVELGDFFTSNAWVVLNITNDDEGWVWFVVQMPFGSTVGKDGSGSIAKVHFSVDNYGSCALDLYNTDMKDSGAYTLPHNAVDGYFSNVPDIAIADVNPQKTTVNLGDMVPIKVTVANLGGSVVTSNVTTYYDNSLVAPLQTVTDMVPGQTKILTFNWNTTGVAEGTYKIKAIVEVLPGELNTTNNAFIDGDVLVTLLFPPVPDFSYSPTSPLVGQTVTFDASASVDPDGTIETYAWDFGDLSTGSGKIVDHVYETAEDFTVKLTVTDNASLTNFIEETVTVSPAPAHNVAISNATTDVLSVTVGGEVSIDVTVRNKGDFSESFNVTVEYDDAVAAKQLVNALEADEERTLSLIWDTAGVVPGNYTLMAFADTVPGEASTADNEFHVSTVEVKAATGFDLTYIIAGVVVLVVVVAVAAYLLRFRKGKKQ